MKLWQLEGGYQIWAAANPILRTLPPSSIVPDSLELADPNERGQFDTTIIANTEELIANDAPPPWLTLTRSELLNL